MLGRQLGAALLVGLLASMPFGSTAFAQLTALGGSTPLIFTLFVVVLLLGMLWQDGILGVFFAVLQRNWEAWLVLGLIVYAIAGASLLPNLFAGMTSAFIPILGAITEVPLAPSTSNITQTAYFTLSCLVYFALSAMLARGGVLPTLRLAFLACCTIHVGLGMLDLAGKFAGLGDILAPIRTASYANMTEAEEGGFWRIVGGYPEASAYALGTLYCLGFSVTLWRRTGSPLSLVLTLALAVLLVMSTSTTAYVGGAIASVPVLAAVVIAALRGRSGRRDLVMLAIAVAAVLCLTLVYLVNERTFDPFVDLLNRMVFEKASSDSGKERAYWNAKSMQAFFDTYGIGIGLGSSRSSSWVISVISQLGVVGAAMVAVLVGAIASALHPATLAGLDREDAGTIASICGCALTHLVALSVSAGSADPGVMVFIALAAVGYGRRLAQSTRRRVAEPAEAARAGASGAGAVPA